MSFPIEFRDYAGALEPEEGVHDRGRDELPSHAHVSLSHGSVFTCGMVPAQAHSSLKQVAHDRERDALPSNSDFTCRFEVSFRGYAGALEPEQGVHDRGRDALLSNSEFTCRFEVRFRGYAGALEPEEGVHDRWRDALPGAGYRGGRRLGAGAENPGGCHPGGSAGLLQSIVRFPSKTHFET